MDLSKINLEMIKRYTSPHAIKDLDRFMDSLPVNVGYNALIAVGMSCLLAAGAVFFASSQAEKVSRLRADLIQVEALRPPVPVLEYVPVPRDVLSALTKKIEGTYKGLSFVLGGDGLVTISATDTDFYPQFLAAISYLQRGGKNWKVSINTLCAGRGCPVSKLTAGLKIDSVRFGEAKKEEDAVKK